MVRSFLSKTELCPLETQSKDRSRTTILWPILERISAVHLRHGFPLLGVLTRFRYMNPRGVVRRGASLVGQESLSLPE